ncbi:MAG: AAA family ATPase [bacterium]
MRYPRLLLKSIERQINSPEIILVTGMRRVGKTALLTIIFDKIESKNKVFLDLDNILEQKIFEEVDYNNIWPNLKPYGITNQEKAFIFPVAPATRTFCIFSTPYPYIQIVPRCFSTRPIRYD